VVELHSRAVWFRTLLIVVSVGAVNAASDAPPKVPPGFVDLAAVAPDIVVDMRYAGADNFLGRPARGYSGARCLLTKEAAGALAAVQRELTGFGVGLKVYDCYRPQRAVDDFVAWSRAPGPATDPRHLLRGPILWACVRRSPAHASMHSRRSRRRRRCSPTRRQTFQHAASPFIE